MGTARKKPSPLSIHCIYRSKTNGDPETKNEPSSFVDVYLEPGSAPIRYRKELFEQTKSIPSFNADYYEFFCASHDDDYYRLDSSNDELVNEGAYGKITAFIRVDNENEMVAVKEIKSLLQPNLLWDIHNECKQAAQVYHTPCAHNLLQADYSKIVIVQPYITGIQFSRRKYSLPSEHFIDCKNVADAVTLLHKNGQVHGDLSPNNILLDDESAQLVDFGLTCNVNVQTKQLLPPNKSFPPEQIIRNNHAALSRDIYKLGDTYTYTYFTKFKTKYIDIENRFFRFCETQMRAANPQSRPPIEAVSAEMDQLIILANFIEEKELPEKDQAKFSEIIYSWLSGPDLPLFLCFMLKLPVEKIAQLKKIIAKNPLLTSDFKQADSSKKIFISYLTTENPQLLIKSLNDLENILKFYSGIMLSNVLENIGLEYIENLIQTDKDLEKIEDLLSQEILLLPFLFKNLNNFLLYCEIFLTELPDFHKKIGSEYKFAARNICLSYSDDDTEINFYQSKVEQMLIKKRVSLIRKSDISELKIATPEYIRTAGHMMQRMFDLKKWFPYHIPPSIERRYLALCIAMQTKDKNKQPDYKLILSEIQNIKNHNEYLANQFNYWNDTMPFKYDDVLDTVKTMEQLLELDLEFLPINRIALIKRINKTTRSQIANLFNEFLKNHPNLFEAIQSLYTYIFSQHDINYFIKSNHHLKDMFSCYPDYTRFRFLQRLDIIHIERLSRNPKDLKDILDLLPKEERPICVEYINFKKKEQPLSSLPHSLFTRKKLRPPQNPPKKFKSFSIAK